jgi:hypothetical protein
MGPSTSVQQITATDEWHDRQLAAAREAFPDWAILEALGGFIAIPSGTTAVRGITLDSLVKNLRQLADATDGP